MAVRKRVVYGLLLLLLFAMCFCILSFSRSARFRHKLARLKAKSQQTIAEWRGNKPRLISITGTVHVPGARIQALDSRSGWAALADAGGRFVLPDLAWYPGATFEIVTANGDTEGLIIEIDAPASAPTNGKFDAGELDLTNAPKAALAGLPGINSITYENYDDANKDYYDHLFADVTVGNSSDEEKVDALNRFVASKLNYDAAVQEVGSPRRVLERGSRYCGQLSLTMSTLLATAGYKTRCIDMRDDNNPAATHVVVEVLYGGGWHLYDPTYGIKFQNDNGKVASYEEVRLKPELIKEELLMNVEPIRRREILSLLTRVYSTGYHHLYCFK